jgi:cell division protease FtsH
MHASFAEARQRAPCILLVDEIDAFPSRADVRHAHRDYTVQVVDALLEQLDGAVPRDGVVVIGTCNDATGLDPALLRPGRLETVIRVPRPDTLSLGLIMRHHLGRDLVDVDLGPLAWAAADAGAVGADVERWCRAARRASRSADRAMRLEDLEGQVPPARLPDTPEERRRICLHEAGHALAWSLSGFDVLMSVRIGRQGGRAGFNELDPRQLFGTSILRSQATMQLRALLAGRAAEIEFLGEASGGAGGAVRSDLASATRLALLMVASLGLDDHDEALVYRGGLDNPDGLGTLILDPDIRRRVAGLLRQCHDDALSLVRTHRDAVERLASALDEHDVLQAAEIRGLLGLRNGGPLRSSPAPSLAARGAPDARP